MSEISKMQDHQLVRVLRDAVPYLLSHKGRKVVVVLPSELANTPDLTAWLDDISLLQHVVGLRFALAFDALALARKSNAEDSKNITAGKIAVTPSLVDCLSDSAKQVQQLLENGFAQAAHGGRAGIGTLTGNPLPAYAAGTVNGKDLELMGVVKELPAADANALLETGKIVLLPPVGAGRDSQILHLDSIEVALSFAKACAADKLVFLLDPSSRQDLDFRQITLAEARARTAAPDCDARVFKLLEAGISALEQGVTRVHYLNMAEPGSMLAEFLSPDGVAAMLSKDRFDEVRTARQEDVNGIIDLIAPNVASGALRPRDPETLQHADFAVVARDDALIACASLSIHGKVAEFGCLAVRPEHSNQAYGQLLLDFFTYKAQETGVDCLVVVTKKAGDWFLERGFELAEPDLLPQHRHEEFSQRGGKILRKKI